MKRLRPRSSARRHPNGLIKIGSYKRDINFDGHRRFSEVDSSSIEARHATTITPEAE